MAKDPAFLFYPGDWLGGTLGMTFEEKGAYIDLLMLQFNRGHMTSHMVGQVIGQLSGQTQAEILAKFKKDADGLYFNERLDVEIEKRKNYVLSRNNNISGKNQYSKKKETDLGHMTSHMENENYILFLKLFNGITGKNFRGSDKDKRQFNARSKEGFTIADFDNAITNCKNDEYHKKNTKYLTPEFITRADKLQAYLNVKPVNSEPILAG